MTNAKSFKKIWVNRSADGDVSRKIHRSPQNTLQEFRLFGAKHTLSKKTYLMSIFFWGLKTSLVNHDGTKYKYMIFWGRKSSFSNTGL